MSENLTKKTVSGFYWLSSGKGIKAITQLIVLAILARLLTPTEFGLMGLALLVVSFSDIFTDFGFGPAITQKKEITEEDIRTAFTFSVFLGILLVIIIWLLAPLLESFFQREDLTNLFRVVSFVLFFRAVPVIALALLYRHMNYKVVAMVELVSYIIGYGIVSIVLAYLDFGVWALMAGVISQSIVSCFLQLIYVKHNMYPMINLKSFKNLSYFGGGYSLGKIFTYAGNQGDKIIIGRILGADALGLYERAYRLIKFIAGLLGEIFDKVLFAPLSKKQSETEKIGKIYIELNKIISTILIPLSVFIIINAESIVLIILGDQWLEIVFTMKLMAVVLFLMISSRIASTIAKAMGDVYKRAIRNLIFAISVIVFSIIGSQWNIEGVAVGVIASQFINYVISFTHIKYLTFIQLSKFIYSHTHGIIISIFVYLFSYINNILFGSISLELILVINTTILTLLLFLYIYIVKDEDMYRYIRIIKNSIK